MKQERIELWADDEYSYPVIGNFRPNIMAYLHDDPQIRPAIVVVPGGGYRAVSCKESEIVAKAFFDLGYQAFVLSYTTNLIGPVPLKKQPLRDLSRAVVEIRRNVAAYCADPKRIVVCGFSAGGHLAGSLAVHFDDPILAEAGLYEGVSNRPDAAILCYPVISSREFVHWDTFHALCGKEQDDALLSYMSLEQHVSGHTPPTFLWHTMDDELVPVENSMMFASACRAKNVPVELHLYSNGKHGMSVATEEWANGPITGVYSMEQFLDALKVLAGQGAEIPPIFANLMGQHSDSTEGDKNHSDRGIAQWPILADAWIKRCINNG